jgi:hypothetical protein
MPRKLVEGAWTWADGREAALQRAGWRCEAERHGFPGCRQRPEVVHHINRRRGLDPHNPDWLVAMCDPCHKYAHDHVAEAEQLGLLVRASGRINQPLFQRREK